jgi:electron transfer flavoprotein beta subunit
MKIITLVKVVPKEMEFDKESKRIKRSKENIINPSDLIAVGNAVELKNKYGFEIDAVSMAPVEAKDTLLKLFDFGIDRIFLLTDLAFANSDVFATSNVLSRFILNFDNDFNFIFTGNYSSDGLTGLLPGEVASKLSILYISNVLSVNYLDGSLLAEKIEKDSLHLLKVVSKAVVSFSDRSDKKALPNLYYIFDENEKHLEIITNEALKLSQDEIGKIGSKTFVNELFKVETVQSNELIKENGDKVIVDIISKEVLK